MPGGQAHDPDLLDVLEAMDPRPFHGSVWRVAWAGRDPLVGGTGGGRWHPPNDFEALYTSTLADGAMAEIYFHLSQAPVFSTSHVTLYEIVVATNRTLVFNDIEALAAIGVDREKFDRGDPTRTREAGSAARFLDFDGLIVPNARWPCTNLVLFTDRLSDRKSLVVTRESDVNWPAWRERTR